MSDSETPITEEDLSNLAIFPLRTAVLLPHVLLPLHIFEERYREMVSHAIADNRPLAIAKIVEDEPIDAESPRVESVVGVGRIIQYEKLDDGRFNVLLAGVDRARIETEIPQENLYREVQATRLQSYVADENALHEASRLLKELIFSLRKTKPAISSVMLRLLSGDLPKSVLLDRLTGTLVLSVAEQQQLLEELNVNARAEILLDKISQLVADGFANNDENGPLIN